MVVVASLAAGASGLVAASVVAVAFATSAWFG